MLGRAISGGLTSVVASAILIILGGWSFFGATVGQAGGWRCRHCCWRWPAWWASATWWPRPCLMLREPNFFGDATNFAFAMISGVAFPVAVLPWFIKPVAYVLPTTYAVDLLRVRPTTRPPAARSRARMGGAGGPLGGHDRCRSLGLPAHRTPDAGAGDARPALTRRPASSPLAHRQCAPTCKEPQRDGPGARVDPLLEVRERKVARAATRMSASCGPSMTSSSAPTGRYRLGEDDRTPGWHAALRGFRTARSAAPSPSTRSTSASASPRRWPSSAATTSAPAPTAPRDHGAGQGPALLTVQWRS